MPNPYSYGTITRGADLDAPTITIEGVTPDNYLLLAKANGLEPQTDAAGNITGWYYVETSSELDEHGNQVDKIYRVMMQAEKDTDHSTVSNVIVKFTPLSASTEYHAHGNMVYIDKNEYLKSALKTAGVNLDLGETDPELVQQIWDRYNELAQRGYWTNMAPPQISADPTADNYGDYLKFGAQYVYMMIKQTMTGQYKTLSSVDSLTAILSAAAFAGIFTDEHLFYDDEITKATMRTAAVGDYIQLTEPTDTLGIPIPGEKAWIGAWVKPLLIAAMFYASLPAYSDFDNLMLPESEPIGNWYEYMQYLYHNQTDEYANFYTAAVDLRTVQVYPGFYSAVFRDESTNRHQIYQNYPQYGYAIINMDTGQALSIGEKHNWYNGQWAGGGIMHPSKLMMIYDWATFFDYAMTQTEVNEFKELLRDYPIVFANCQYIATKPEGVTYDPDVMTIPQDALPEDIEPMIPTAYPDWWDDGDEVPQYDPGTDTTPNKPYLPIGINTSTPRSSTPDPISVTLPYIDMIVPHVDIPSVPSIPVSQPAEASHSNKFFTVYAPTSAQLDSLGGELWDQNVVELLKQTFVSPTDGILGFHQMYLTPTVAQTDSAIMIGNYTCQHATAKKVTSYRAYLNCGEVAVPRFYNDYRDFTETRVLVFLPFIGFQELDPRDVIGCNVKIEYRADVLTGVCVASISPKKGGSANSQVQQCAYMFTGNCAVQVPITAADRSRLLSGALTGAGSGATLGGKAGALFGGAGAGIGAVAGGIIGGALGGIAGYNGGVMVSNGFNANAGALTPYKAPYILIMRNRPADTQYQSVLRGEPANTLVTLKDVKGYTKVKEIYLNIPKATDEEKSRIKGILQSGVIL